MIRYLGLLLGILGLLLSRPGFTQPPPPPAEEPPAEKPAPATGLPAGAIARLGSNFLYNTGTINAATFTPDGKQVITGGYGHKLVYWDTRTRTKGRELDIKPPVINSLGMSRDGKTLLLGDNTGLVLLLDPATGAVRTTLMNPKLRGAVKDVALSADGKTVAVTVTGYLMLWDVEKKALRTQVGGFRSYEMPVAFSPDSKHAIVVGKDYKVHYHDAETGKDVRTLELPPRTPGAPGVPASAGQIRALAVSPDGKYLAGAGSNRTLALWEADTGKPIKQIPMPDYNTPRALAFRPDGRFLATGSGSLVHVFGVASGKVLRQFTTGDTVRTLAWSPDGSRLVCTGGGNRATLWDVPGDEALHETTGHLHPPYNLQFSPDGKAIATAGADSTLRRWEVATGKERAMERKTSLSVSPLRWTSPGSLAVLGHNELYRWPAEGELTTQPLDEVVRRASNKVLAPDGQTLALGMPDRKLKIYSLAEGKELHELPMPTGFFPYQMEFGGGGTRLAARCSDSLLHVWDVTAGEEYRVVGAELPIRRSVNLFSFAEDGRVVAVYDTGVRVVELASGLDLLSLPRGPEPPRKLACSPDGRLVALGYDHGRIHVHDTITGKLVLEGASDQGNIRQLNFSPDGRLLASAGQDTTALIWRVPEPADLAAGKREMETLWADLGSADPKVGFRAMAHLAGKPDEAVAMIREHLKPTEVKTDPERIKQLIGQLDDDDFLTRENATKQLEVLGRAAEAALRGALKSPSLEVRRRAAALLKKITGEGVNLELVRTVRAIQVLEQADTPAARDFLAELSKQKLAPAVASEVRSSLVRMKGVGSRE